ncbi:MAG: hypothetical protein D6790_14125 [Caldilineae bacterium]|nr:MAG: hypothetical protein D6790_14125 [Caldilineae bacterium]
MERALSRARREAVRLGSPRVGTEHLLLGMLAGRFYGLGRASAVAEMLARKYKVTYRDVRRLLRERTMADA